MERTGRCKKKEEEEEEDAVESRQGQGIRAEAKQCKCERVWWKKRQCEGNPEDSLVHVNKSKCLHVHHNRLL